MHTADFLEAFDQLFNAFNSCSLESSTRIKSAFTATSGHVEFLTDKLVATTKESRQLSAAINFFVYYTHMLCIPIQIYVDDVWKPSFKD